MIADNNATLWVFSPSHRSDEDPVNLVLSYRSSPRTPAWKYEFSCQSIPKLALSHSQGDIWALGCPSQQARLHNGEALTSSAGTVTLFQWNETKGRARIVQTIYGKNTTDQLGTSIAMSADGKTIALVASASRAKEKKGSETSNYLDIYRLDAQTKKWLPLGSTIPDATKVALSSDGNIVAAMTSTKVSRVFHYSTKVQDWEEENFQVYRKRALSSSSLSLAGNGNVLSLLQESNGIQSIHIYHRIWQRQKGHTWILDSTIPTTRTRRSSFGWVASLSADGTRIAIAEPSHQDGSGAVYVYEYNRHKWEPSGNPILAMSPSRRDSFGRHLHMSQDGNQLVAKAVSYTAIYQFIPANEHGSCGETTPNRHKEEL